MYLFSGNNPMVSNPCSSWVAVSLGGPFPSRVFLFSLLIVAAVLFCPPAGCLAGCALSFRSHFILARVLGGRLSVSRKRTKSGLRESKSLCENHGAQYWDRGLLCSTVWPAHNVHVSPALLQLSFNCLGSRGPCPARTEEVVRVVLVPEN